MGTPRRVLSARLVAALTAAALVAGACGNASGPSSAPAPASDGGGGPNASPGVTDDEIRFAAFGTRSNNPLGTCVLDCYVAGINAYFEFRNSQGGAHGRKLVLPTVLDDELAQNQQRALEIVSANDTFAAFSATMLGSGFGDVADAGIPLYTWALDFTAMEGRESIFANAGVVCASCVQKADVYAAKMSGATKIGALGYGAVQSSKDCVAQQTRSVERYQGATGQSVVHTNDNLEFGLPNGIATEVTAMKDAGVDFVMTCMDLNGVKTLAQELERQGMGHVPVLHPNTYDADFIAGAGALFDGDIVAIRYRPFEADPAGTGLADFKTYMEKAGQKLSELALIGWINADLAYRGIVDAGPGFDRAGVIAATNRLTAFTAGGLINPIDWSRQHKMPTEEDPLTNGYKRECTAYVKVAGGRFELVGDRAKPFHCWDNAKLGEWTEPELTTFE